VFSNSIFVSVFRFSVGLNNFVRLDVAVQSYRSFHLLFATLDRTLFRCICLVVVRRRRHLGRAARKLQQVVSRIAWRGRIFRSNRSREAGHAQMQSKIVPVGSKRELVVRGLFIDLMHNDWQHCAAHKRNALVARESGTRSRGKMSQSSGKQIGSKGIEI
jgi:hypothetical protein